MNFKERKRFNFPTFLEMLVVFMAIVASACFFAKPIYFDDDRKAAEKHVSEFHRLFNEEQYDVMLSLFNNEMQARQTRDQFVSALQKLRTEAGSVKISRLMKSNIKVEASYRVVHLYYETEFENEKRFEEFDCLVDGVNAVFGYYGQPIEIPSD